MEFIYIKGSKPLLQCCTFSYPGRDFLHRAGSRALLIASFSYCFNDCTASLFFLTESVRRRSDCYLMLLLFQVLLVVAFLLAAYPFWVAVVIVARLPRAILGYRSLDPGTDIALTAPVAWATLPSIEGCLVNRKRGHSYTRSCWRENEKLTFWEVEQHRAGE